MPVSIRPLQAADFSAGFLETLSNLAPADLPLAEAKNIWLQRTAAGIHSIVAELDGRVVGTASLLVEKKFIHRGGLVGHIEDVAVHGDFSGRGIGAQLVKWLVEMATSLGCYKVILNCHDPLVPFYTKVGFRRQDNGMRLDCHPERPPEKTPGVVQTPAAPSE